jgi:gas vesicle protein
MEHLSLASFERLIFVVIAAIALPVLAPPLLGQQDRPAAGSPEAAWSTIQQLVQSLENAVQSKNLHGIHEPSMKIRAPIRSLKQHCSMLSVDISKEMTAALKQLDNSITDLHSAADEGNQQEAESSLKEVEAAFDQLKSLDPDTAFKSVVH